MTPHSGASARSLMLLAGLPALLLYWPAQHYGLFWDDHVYLGGAAAFHDWPSLWSWASSPFFGYLRPLPLLTLGAEQLIGGAPATSHMVQILLHALNGALVASVTLLILPNRNRWVALAAGVLYTLHPALSESALWLSARFDVLVTTFVLLALLVERSTMEWNLKVVGVGLLFFLALLCKEMALGFLLLLPIWRIALAGKTERASPRLYFAVALPLAIYLALRMHALEGNLAIQPEAPIWGSPIEHAALVCKTLGAFARMALLPFFDVSVVHPLKGPVGWLDPEVFLGLVCLATTPLLVRRVLNGSRVAGLLLCALASLTPVLNLVSIGISDNYFHERFLVLPLTFVAMAAGFGLNFLIESGRRTPAAAALVLVLLPVAARSHANLEIWRNDITVWSHALGLHPDSEVAADNLLTALLVAHREGELVATARALEQVNGPLTPFQRWRYAEGLAAIGQADAALQQIEVATQQLPATDRRLREHLADLANRIRRKP